MTHSCLPRSGEYLTGKVPLGAQFLLVHGPHHVPCVGATIQFAKKPG